MLQLWPACQSLRCAWLLVQGTALSTQIPADDLAVLKPNGTGNNLGPSASVPTDDGGTTRCLSATSRPNPLLRVLLSRLCLN